MKCMDNRTESKILALKEELKQQKKDTVKYKKAYHEVMCYFDSISDEEKPKLLKRLDKILHGK